MAPQKTVDDYIKEFLDAEAAVPASAVCDSSRWPAWKRFDRQLNEAIASADLTSVRDTVKQAALWANAERTRCERAPLDKRRL